MSEEEEDDYWIVFEGRPIPMTQARRELFRKAVLRALADLDTTNAKE